VGTRAASAREPDERTSVAEHADDAAALLDALADRHRRSYGGTVASDLALRYPEWVRALVLLEPDAPRQLTPAAAEWVDRLGDRLRAVAEEAGVEAVGEALITEVAGKDAWRAFPDEWRPVVTESGPAILAELEGEWWLDAYAAALPTIEHPVLLVAAADSLPEFYEPIEAIGNALPNARTALVGGGHIIDPASPEALAFIGARCLSVPRRIRGPPQRRVWLEWWRACASRVKQALAPIGPRAPLRGQGTCPRARQRLPPFVTRHLRVATRASSASLAPTSASGQHLFRDVFMQQPPSLPTVTSAPAESCATARGEEHLRRVATRYRSDDRGADARSHNWCFARWSSDLSSHDAR
jgi:hypothetical protein